MNYTNQKSDVTISAFKREVISIWIFVSFLIPMRRPILYTTKLRAFLSAGLGLIASTAFFRRSIRPKDYPFRLPHSCLAIRSISDLRRARQRLTTACIVSGEISAPLLGAVKVSGLSLRETESMMEKRYRDGGFFLNPQVILSFESYAPRTISVLGQVNNPIQVEFSIERDQMGIVSAITRAGGFTRVARTDAVKVMRIVEGKETAFTVNVTAYLNETSKEQEFRLFARRRRFCPRASVLIFSMHSTTTPFGGTRAPQTAAPFLQNGSSLPSSSGHSPLPTEDFSFSDLIALVSHACSSFVLSGIGSVGAVWSQAPWDTYSSNDR